MLETLNKLNSQNSSSLVPEIATCLQSSQHVSFFIELLFKKAINENKFCENYVQFFCDVKSFCQRNGTVKDSLENDKDLFSKLLVIKSQQLFHDKKNLTNIKSDDVITIRHVGNENTNENITENINENTNVNENDEYEREIRKLEFFGTIRVINQLYLKNAVRIELPLLCLKELLGTEKKTENELFLEAFTIMLKDLWKTMKSQIENEENLYEISYENSKENSKENSAKYVVSIEQRQAVGAG